VGATLALPMLDMVPAASALRRKQALLSRAGLHAAWGGHGGVDWPAPAAL
jgi:hypothetical protein